MNSFFYLKLAANNLKKNSKTYIPYILTCIGTIIMFYNMSFLSSAKNIGSSSESLRIILSFGTYIIGIFSIIFLFYTNSFLIKRRKKEFGLFNILGMEKKHIAWIMLFETLLVAVISILAGILSGILLSKLIQLLLFKIISFKVSFGFEIPLKSIIYSLILFSGIFTLNLVNNLFRIHLSKPVELLKGGNVGEKEPKTKWLLTVFGTICLGIGYYIALTTESPIAALYLFLVATVLVMAGTYSLFTAGSIAVLKLLRRNKNYYYKLKHFNSVSGMIYRMKQNATGLANICILSTAVIIMLSTTLSLYIGFTDVLKSRYPQKILVSANKVSNIQASKLNEVIQKEAVKANIKPKNVANFRAVTFTTIQKEDSFTYAKKSAFSSKNFAILIIITLEDFNKMENRSVVLSDKEALIYPLGGKIHGDAISFNGYTLNIKEQLKSIKTEGKKPAALSNSYYVVVDSFATIKKINDSLKNENAKIEQLSYYYGFDTDADKATQLNLVKALQKSIKSISSEAYADGVENSRENFFALYGCLFFLGIFLGILFIMATVLIIYYKQIAEGYEDKERFNIMQKVGMSRDEIKKTINSQVLMVFFLPLVTAIIHLAFAFKVITKLLLLFNLTNINLFITCTAITILVFALFYTIVYALTARTYYRIVS